MREKGHQNWPLVIRPPYDPHLPFSGGSVSRPWSKRDTSSSIPLSPRDECPSLSHCNHFLWARKPQTKACLFLPTSLSAEKEIQLIFMRLSGSSGSIIMKERIVSSLVELKHVTPGNGLVLLLSCLWEWVSIFLARGTRGDASQELVGLHGIRRGESNMLFWSFTKRCSENNHGIILLPLFRNTQRRFCSSSSLKVIEGGLYLLDSLHQLCSLNE